MEGNLCLKIEEGFLRYRLGGLIFAGAYTWRGLFSEFYGNSVHVGASVCCSACIFLTFKILITNWRVSQTALWRLNQTNRLIKIPDILLYTNTTCLKRIQKMIVQ